MRSDRALNGSTLAQWLGFDIVPCHASWSESHVPSMLRVGSASCCITAPYRPFVEDPGCLPSQTSQTPREPHVNQGAWKEPKMLLGGALEEGGWR